MKFSEIKVGQYVEDTYWPERYSGRVIEKLKTRIKIKNRGDDYSNSDLIVYDKAHCQFLRLLGKVKSTRKRI